jgi:hypothetical protein
MEKRANTHDDETKQDETEPSPKTQLGTRTGVEQTKAIDGVDVEPQQPLV